MHLQSIAPATSGVCVGPPQTGTVVAAYPHYRPPSTPGPFQGLPGIPAATVGGHTGYLLPQQRLDDSSRKCVVIDLDETLVHSSFKVRARPRLLHRLLHLFRCSLPCTRHWIRRVDWKLARGRGRGIGVEVVRAGVLPLSLLRPPCARARLRFAQQFPFHDCALAVAPLIRLLSLRSPIRSFLITNMPPVIDISDLHLHFVACTTQILDTVLLLSID